MPSVSASSCASVFEWSDEYRDGIDTPCTCSAPERIDGDRRDDRRVDAARQPDHHIAEAVLAAVVTRPEHERVVQLAVGVERFGDRRGQRLAIVDDRGVRHLDDRQHRLGHPPTRVEQPLAVHGRDRHVDDHQRLDELRRPSEQRALVVEHERTAVEDQLVLTADLVDVDDRAVRVGRPRREHPLASLSPCRRRTATR